MLTRGDAWPEGDAVMVNPLARTLRRHGREIRLSPNNFWLAVALLTAGPDGRSFGEIGEVVWGDDADGGPLAVRNSLSVALHRLELRLARLGLMPVNVEYSWPRRRLLADMVAA